MYKSAKGEIQRRQGGFWAYGVSGKTPLIHKGRVEGEKDLLQVKYEGFKASHPQRRRTIRLFS